MIGLRSKAIEIVAIGAMLALAAGCGGKKNGAGEGTAEGRAARGGADEPVAAREAEPERPEAESRPAGGKAEQGTRAPDEFTAVLDTTAGEIRIEVHREWAPRGADRFHELVESGYYSGCPFFRVLDGFMAQVGISPDPALNAEWRKRRIEDDPVEQSNTRGRVSFAMAGPDSRTTQFFVNYGDNSKLDRMGFAPFGEVSDMKAVDELYSGYGECAPKGRGPSQRRLQTEGEAYWKKEFPELDVIRSARIVEQR
jgi:peptidyl-prolyl cis-trans isomerase A (cyclophilin A)